MEKQGQLAKAFRVFAEDNNDHFPLQALNHRYIYPPGGTGTSPGAVASTDAKAWQVFQSMWNELQTPKVLLCPQDAERIGAAERVTNFNGLAGATNELTTASLGHPSNQNLAVSYAVQALADESRPLALLTIDRKINRATNWTASRTPVAASGSRVAIGSAHEAKSLSWVGPPWPRSHGYDGIFSLADGSVMLADQRKLTESLLNAGTAYGWGTTTSNGFGAAVFLLP